MKLLSLNGWFRLVSYVCILSTVQPIWAHQKCANVLSPVALEARNTESTYGLLRLLAIRGLKIPIEYFEAAETLYFEYKNNNTFSNWLVTNAVKYETPLDALNAYEGSTLQPSTSRKPFTWDLTQSDGLGDINTSNPIKVPRNPMVWDGPLSKPHNEHLTAHEEMILKMRYGDELILPKATGQFREILESDWYKLENRPKFYKVRRQDPSRRQGPDNQNVYLVPEYKGENLHVKLGKFLGSGNQTVIFEILDRPGYVIRLPFRTLYTRYVNNARSSELVDSRRKLFEMVAGKPPTTKPVEMVDVNEFGPGGEFIITNQINGNLNGKKFVELNKEVIDEIQHRDLENENSISSRVSSEIASKLGLTVHEVFEIHMMYRALIETNSRIDSLNDTGVHQLLWDINRNIWVLVDYG